MGEINKYPQLFTRDLYQSLVGHLSIPEPVPTTRPSKVMTVRKIKEQILKGFGQGHGSAYQPWLQIRRKNSSPESNQIVSWMPQLGRAAHYFSRGEYHLALLLLWLGVQDLREQYPIWPIPHPHPLTGTLGFQGMDLKMNRGLMMIAKEAGIKHGVNVGTRIPYVATLDHLATAYVQEDWKLVGFSSKPITNSDQEVKERALERLEMERLYLNEIGGKYFVVNSALILSVLAGQLECWIDCGTSQNISDLVPLVDYFADYINASDDLSVAESVLDASKKLSIPAKQGWILFRHCAWTQKIDIDPMSQIITSQPIKRGGISLRAKLRERLFGGDW